MDIPAGAKVRLVSASANQDEKRFTDPEEFGIDRPTADLRGHVAFGHGPHACLGSALARWEITVALETVLAGCPGSSSTRTTHRCPARRSYPTASSTSRSAGTRPAQTLGLTAACPPRR